MQNKELTSFSLKLIAIITMTIDHIGAILFPELIWLRIIGRISFVLFAFLIAVGMSKSKNKAKYLSTLAIASIITAFVLIFLKSVTEIPSTVATNIFTTLFLGAFGIYMIQIYNANNIILKMFNYLIVSVFLFVVVNLLIYYDLAPMYGLYGVLLIFNFYYILQIPNRILRNIGEIVVLLALNLIFHRYPDLQSFSLLALPFIILFSGERGYYNPQFKYFFYFYYPLHLAVIYLISYL